MATSAGPAYGVKPTTDNYVSSLDIHKPHRRAELYARYTGKNMLAFFDAVGQMEPVDQTAFSHDETDHIQEYATVHANVADPTVGLPITFRMSANDHGDSGTTSLGWVGQLVMFPNKVRGYIRAKDTTTAGQHTLTVYPLKTANNIGALTAGDNVIFYSNAFAEKTGQPPSELGRTIKLSFTSQMIKRSYEVSGTEATNVLWFKVPGVNGQSSDVWRLKGELDTFDKFMMDIEAAQVLGESVTQATLVADGIRAMDGAFTFAEANGGIVHKTGGAGLFSLPQLDQIIMKLNKQYGSKENTVWLGLQLRQDWENFIIEAMKNGAITYGAFNGKKEIAVAFGFSSIHRLGYTFHLKTYDLLDHPKMFGAPGFDYSSWGFIVPDEPVMDATKRVKKKPVIVRYKAKDSYKRDMEHWLTGSVILGNKTSEDDLLRSNYRCERSVEVFGPNKFVTIKPS